MGPDGKTFTVASKQRLVLSDYYDRYCTRGFIQKYEDFVATMSRPITPKKTAPIVAKINRKSTVTQISNPPPAALQQQSVIKRRQQIIHSEIKKNIVPPQPIVNRIGTQTIVGRKSGVDPVELLLNNLKQSCYPISNGIGVGILSYNRADVLRRLLNSVVQYTDLRKTTVFISDDGSTEPESLRLLDEIEKNPNITVLRNNTRIGVAGNTNRLLRCLKRFQYGILLNDDVELLKDGWEYFYPDAMKITHFHHFMYHQEGVYGAKEGQLFSRNGIDLHLTKERPHGAVLAFTNVMLNKCGYFDEGYGHYGLEHVDWSQKAYENQFQDYGFFDVGGSNNYFRIHTDTSAVENKNQLLAQARVRFETRSVVPQQPTEASIVPKISYIIPFRNLMRESSILSVVNNIRAQRFPEIEIIMVEQDAGTRINVEAFQPVIYCLAEEHNNLLFNKSKAFNHGVSKVSSDAIILHDADTMVVGQYTRKIAEYLKDYDGCHLGGTVIYTTEESAKKVNTNKVVDETTGCDKTVGYYEGGSIACRLSTFWKVGGFNEDFWGYGVEDCDFYGRLSKNCNWKEDRVFDLLHLWHPRTSGWNTHHEINKALEKTISPLPMSERISNQHKQLQAAYGEIIAKYVNGG